MNELSITKRYYIEVLDKYFNHEHIETNNTINYKELYDLARLQNQTAIIYDALKDVMPKEYVAPFKNDYDSTVFKNVNRSFLINKIDKLFKENNIPYFMVKGTIVGNLYPNPLLRVMGDSDLVVKKEDRVRADEILVNNLKFDKSIDAHEWVYFKNGFEFELHDALVYEDDKQIEYFSDLWNHVYEKDNKYYLDENYHFVFLIAHLKKHVQYEGCGFRQFVDIALATKNWNLDWNLIKNDLEKIDAYNFAITALTFNNLWFGVPNPYGNKELPEEFKLSVIEHMYNFGVFGHDDPDYQSYKMVDRNKDIDSGEKGTILKRIKFFFRLLFPERKQMLACAYMRYFANKPLLLPLAYLYRYYYLLTHRLNDAVKVVTVSQDKIEKRTSDLKNWGIR